MCVELAAVGIGKSYRKGSSRVRVLTGVDLTVDQGEFLAIVGASGSGKSTLLQVVGLLDEPDFGSVHYRGRPIHDLPERRRAELRNHTFGFIFQAYHLLPEMSALENVMLPLLIRHGVLSYFSLRSAIRSEATSLLERVGLGHRLHHRPSELSGGEMQRAAIARALAGGPEILLADEPTGNLDTATGQSILELLHELNRENGLTLVMVTHDPNIASQADRIVRLADGRIEDLVLASGLSGA